MRHTILEEFSKLFEETDVLELSKMIREAGWKVSASGRNPVTRDALLSVGNFDVLVGLTSGKKTSKLPVNSYVEGDEGTLKRKEKFSSEEALSGLKNLKKEIENFKKFEDFLKAGFEEVLSFR